MAWYSSWIPGLPNFNFSIPASIQGRFISFVLKKSLGHLLKPGQLDYRQIDSQIGSGYVQVNDLELNSETVNDYLTGLPLTLQDGTISSVKVRIPWPNPLASTLGFSLNSVHLTFCVTPMVDVEQWPEVDLTDSVASVAESFIHEQLSPREEETLWQSLHHELADQPENDEQFLPGGLDTSANASDLHKFDLDPAGISVFASLIERLLARFEFDAQDVKVTLIHPQNIGLTLSLQDIRYHTDTAGTSRPSFSVEIPVEGERHTLSIQGISLSSRDLSVRLDPSFFSNRTESPLHSSSGATSRPLSRASSNASMDEEAQFNMSQSLASLPPRPSSPSSSASSSMYESAISNVFSIPPVSDNLEENPAMASPQLPEEIILSFGSQPVLFKAMTPSPSLPVSEDDPFLFSTDSTSSPEDQVQVTLSIGVMGCIIKPWQALGLLRLAQAMVPPKMGIKTTSTPKTSTAGAFPPIKARADVRAAVLLLVPTESNPSRRISTQEFFDRPLVPPKLEHGYTRILLESVSSSLSIPNESFMKETKSKLLPASKPPLTNLEINIADFSIFFFSKPATNLNSALVAFPLLIRDPHLSMQYPQPHIHHQSGQTNTFLPTFDIIDWKHETSQNFGTRLSYWRCQPPRTNASDRSDTGPEPEDLSSGNSAQPALRLVANHSVNVGGDKSMAAEVVDDLDIQVAPLHIRVDLQCILQPEGPLTFFEDILLTEIPVSDEASFSSETTVDKSFIAFDRKRPGRHERSANSIDDDNASQHSHLVINFRAIRLSVRCPPPPQFTTRSGALVLDFHDTRICLGSKPSKPSAKFADQDGSPARDLGMPKDRILLKATFNRIILACSMVNEKTATAFVSIGPLTDDDSGQFIGVAEHTSLQPHIVIIKPDSKRSEAAPSLALSIDVPSVLVDLSKPNFDSLQYWADDVNQLLERLSGHEKEAEVSNSRDTSLVGSRFFAKSRSGSRSALGSNANEAAENVIKLSITETVVRVLVPRTDNEKSEPRPFYINASDLDILVELNPDHKVLYPTTSPLGTLVDSVLKQETILTVGIMDLVVENTSQEGDRQRFLSLTSPHSLSTSAKSILKLRLLTATVPETSSKETRIKLTLCGFTYTFFPDLHWISDLLAFAKNPPGTFESVIPSDRTRIFVKISDGSIRVLAPIYPGALVSCMQELEFSTDVIGDSRDSSFHITATSLALLAIDDTQDHISHEEDRPPSRGISAWTTAGYALLAEVSELDTTIINQLAANPLWKVLVERTVLRLHLCADTLTAVSMFSHDLGVLFKNPDEKPEISNRRPTVVGRSDREDTAIMSSVEDLAFKRVPEIGPAPDMIYDDLPANLDYLDESFGAAAGLRELVDEDLDEFDDRIIDTQAATDDSHIVSSLGGETVKIFDAKGLDLVEDYYLSMPPEKLQSTSYSNDAILSIRVIDGAFNLFLYDGYDWGKTRKTIEEEVKEMRKRLAKIRQLVANGQIQDPIVEDTSALLFNSVHIGLDQDEDGFEEPSVLIAAIDEELKDDLETTSQSSWQSLRQPSSNKPRARSTRIHGKKLTRSRAPSMEFSLAGLFAEFDQFKSDDPLVSRTFITIKDLEILDHIKTSTWKKFLTELRSDSRGNIRETNSNMVRIELSGIRPVESSSSEEVRLRAKILPLRLYVDQDAVDFMKKFFSFKAPTSMPSDTPQPSDEGETYIQLGEIFPVDLKLDYKPRRVDYRALKEGRTIELMNFFHFDGAEMTLRHITLAGVTGWSKFFEMLNDLWTPDVKATQLAEVISGVAPIRSIVNVGSGVADLILLPIAQYKKDGRIVRGVQKGATAFVKSTAIEAIKMGAKLATGTQVILEQAEGILGGHFEAPITAEPVQLPYGDELGVDEDEDDNIAEMISKYAQQPTDLREGVQFAYQSLQRNLNSAAQTILAVPMEVYERSGNEGPVRSVIRAVPIAVLKPMIGASEAVSKTLLGLHNTLDPNVRHDNEAKYKLR